MYKYICLENIFMCIFLSMNLDLCKSLLKHLTHLLLFDNINVFNAQVIVNKILLDNNLNRLAMHIN